MTAARTPKLFSYLIAAALVLAVIPAVGVLDASAGDETCCPPEDPCCPDTESDDQGCCPSDCSVCLLTCCATPASMLSSPVSLEMNQESDTNAPLCRSASSSIESRGIYHPPRR